MKSKASRLLALYGLSLVLLGALGWLAGSEGGELRYGLLSCIGAAAVVCSSLLKKDNPEAFTASLTIVGSGLLLSLWFAVQGVVGLIAGKGGVLIETTFFVFTAMFSIVLLPVLVRAWKLYRRFFQLFE